MDILSKVPSQGAAGHFQPAGPGIAGISLQARTNTRPSTNATHEARVLHEGSIHETDSRSSAGSQGTGTRSAVNEPDPLGDATENTGSRSTAASLTRVHRRAPRASRSRAASADRKG